MAAILSGGGGGFNTMDVSGLQVAGGNQNEFSSEIIQLQQIKRYTSICLQSMNSYLNDTLVPVLLSWISINGIDSIWFDCNDAYSHAK